MKLHNTQKIYSGKADFYVTGRPTYPSELLSFIQSTFNINLDSTIADIGAGTGIFTRCLLDSGAYVYAVEPNSDMLKKATQVLKNFPKFIPVNALAQKTMLSTSSIDLLTVAQALHWFNTKETKKEFERILRPEGNYLFLWNERMKDCDSFHQNFEAILSNTIESYSMQAFKDMSPRKLVASFLGSEDFITQTLSNQQLLPLEGLLGRVFSSSYSPNILSKSGKILRENLEKLFEEFHSEGNICMKYETIIIYARNSRC